MALARLSSACRLIATAAAKPACLSAILSTPETAGGGLGWLGVLFFSVHRQRRTTSAARNNDTARRRRRRYESTRKPFATVNSAFSRDAILTSLARANNTADPPGRSTARGRMIRAPWNFGAAVPV